MRTSAPVLKSEGVVDPRWEEQHTFDVSTAALARECVQSHTSMKLHISILNEVGTSVERDEQLGNCTIQLSSLDVDVPYSRCLQLEDVPSNGFATSSADVQVDLELVSHKKIERERMSPSVRICLQTH